ncbi:MAG: holo-ACP synthase [Acidobacteriota bacterium]|jgi:holo-[acyl-carrier protein] synthase
MHLIGIGVDLVEVARLDRALRQHGERFVARVYREEEARYCRDGARPVERFAVRFAAKEAVMKALGTGWAAGVGFQQIEVVRDGGGAPSIRLHGEARRRAEAMGVQDVAISLSHTASCAVAFVVCRGI